ncbi:RICIN domain-containing protein [Marinilabilia rubra]|uniref:Ricin B lectin domain-containing protein n=1 Tax=Marinilabilia rubra TaxID=2162893 RepID=A0A2U2B977_9BACT|nr:RICIN domain-containing protein [Marinilabilia rubra]PWD99629.1 hypothetical protein DDZ16_09285 [Marinilabilia rubra]
MKIKVLLLFVFITVSGYAQNTQKINVNGFGELAAVQNGNMYSITIADYGTFDFEGSLNPLELKGEVTIDQLEKIPGYNVLKDLGLQDICFEMSKEGLMISANADTEKNLKNLCTLLKVTTPTVGIQAKIGMGTFELSGDLAFSKEPIKILEVEKSGTTLSYYSAGLGAAYQKGSFILTVSLNMIVKPSEFDPDLNMNYQFGYDLVKQTIMGSASMMSTWTDPFGMDRFFNKNSVIFSKGASALAVNIPAQSISQFGFAIERAKYFDVDFGTFVSISPLDGEVALRGRSNSKISLDQIPEMLKKGFSLDFPNVFPPDYELDSAEIKFAPTGGTVGDLELTKGFALVGVGKFKELDFFLDFNFDLENEFRYKMHFTGDYSKFIWNEAHKIPNKTIRNTVKQALDEIQIQKMYLDLDAQKKNLSLNGEMHCEFKYQNKLQKISFEASLDAEQIVKDITNKLIEKFGGPIVEEVEKVAKHAANIAKDAGSISKAMMNDIKTYAEHTHPKERCHTKCVPDRAYELSRHIVDGSYDAVRRFYFNTFNEIGQIEGDTPEETRRIRSKLIKKDWDKICRSIDEDWKEILNDRAFVKYYTSESDAKNGVKIYYAEVKKYMKKEKAYRDKVWERMLTREWKKTETATLKGEEIPKGTYYIKSVKAGNSDNGYFDITYDHGKKKWKMKGQRLQIWTKDNSGAKQYKFHRNNYLSYYIITPASDHRYALDLKGRGRNKRTPIHLWRLHKGASQQFYFKHVGGGKFVIIPRTNRKMCLALKDNNNANKGNKVHLWTYHNTPSKQWYLINVKTGKKYIPN